MCLFLRPSSSRRHCLEQAVGRACFPRLVEFMEKHPGGAAALANCSSIADLSQAMGGFRESRRRALLFLLERKTYHSLSL